MRKISAHYIFNGIETPVKFGVISLIDKEVVAISQPVDRLAETAQTEFYPGVIIPAIVNVTAENDRICCPKGDEEVEQLLKNYSGTPKYFVITSENIFHLSEVLLQKIMQSGAKLVLGSPNDSHPATLFRLMCKLADRLSNSTFSEIVEIATVNGANALNLTQRGSILPHKQPGIYHISGFNFAKMNIDQNSKITVLLD